MDSNTLIIAILLCSVNAFFMIAGIFLNSVVIISLMRSSQLRKNLGYFMILVQSSFDLAVVTFSYPMLLLSTISWSVKTHHQGENEFGNWANIIAHNMAGFSMSALLTMTVERYLESNAFIIVFILLFLVLFVYLNYNMFIIAKSKSKVENSAATQGDKESKRRKLNFKNISICSMAISCFFICALPQIIFLILRSTNTLSNERDIYEFKLCAITLFNINFTLNCLIFFWRNSILRREGMRTVK